MSTHPGEDNQPAAVPARRQGPLDPYEGEDEDPQVRLDLDLDSDPNWDFDGYRVGPDGGMVAPSEMTKTTTTKDADVDPNLIPLRLTKRDVSGESRDAKGEWVCSFCGLDKETAIKENAAGKTCPAHADQPHGSGSKIPGQQWSREPGEDPDGPKTQMNRTD